MSVLGRLTGLLLFVALACCQTSQGFWHSQATGQRVDATPGLLSTFQKNRAVCDGEAEAAKPVFASTMLSASSQKPFVKLIFDSCMRERGYVRKAG